ncbi:SH3 domain-containing protein [Bacillus ginsengihumi]|uniref:SH3 domain-containing protein n=3 Tax=Heyndrickxia ginsengihumi TaxID=363870 RepID=A0A6M0P562_9BACI|nr:SH3 domain-containing protein [Heyndrickxia ginsengihumi]NEY19415.1 SH3 domain-containing protein [Heyndrickxia ginsengihumi]
MKKSIVIPTLCLAVLSTPAFEKAVHAASPTGTKISSSDSTTKSVTKYVNVDANSSLLLRSKPSTSASTLDRLKRGTAVTVYSISGNWAKVKVDGKTGYVSAEYLVTTKPSSSTGSSSSTTTKYVNVDKGSHLILRSTASTSGSVLASLNPGTSVTVISTSGAWSKVKAGSQTGYVHSEYLTTTKPSSTSSSSSTTKTTTKYVNVDKGSHLILRSTASTSGSVLASLDPGTSVTVLSTSGEWSKVQVGSKTGYVHTEYLTTTKPSSTSNSSSSTTKTTTKYVNVDKGSHLILRSTASTSGSVLASLNPGTSVTVISTSGEWSKVQVGNKTGYVHTEYLTSTKPSTSDDQSGNSDSEQTVTKYTTADLNLRKSNSTSSSVITVIPKGTAVTVYSETNGWARVTVNGNTGYVSTKYLTGGATLNGKVTTVEQDYDISLSQLTNIEMKASPQTDTNNRYVRSDAVKKTSSTTGTLDGSWNVRDGAGTNYDVAETLPSGTSVTILDTVAGTDGHTWYKISYNKTWKNATANEVEYYLNPKNFINDPVSSLQFLKLSTTANIDVNEVNQKILAGKGTLAGKAQSFITAAKTYGVNELYLISHALLETGNGTSQLAKGYPYTYKGKTYTVYNMYGIGAYDGNAVEDGAAYAYSQGWFSPEAAIIGGARFIANGYISAGQDTLYAMRWNPSGAATYGYATHQYATDIGWAYKQVNEIYNLYNLLDSYSITLEVPNYK